MSHLELVEPQGSGWSQEGGDAEKPGFLEAQVSHPGFHLGTEWKMQGQLLGRPETQQVQLLSGGMCSSAKLEMKVRLSHQGTADWAGLLTCSLRDRK